jgi:uncharacterized protein YecT (DUF1311 family)
MAAAGRNGRHYGVFAGLVALLAAGWLPQPAWARNSPWEDTWRSKDPAILEGLTLQIDGVTREGFLLTYDEGQGANGFSGQGEARFTNSSNAKIVLSPGGKPCEATLALRGKELTFSGCHLAQDAPESLVLLPVSLPRHFSAGFDCRRASNATEKRICSDRALARLDKTLAQTYGKLRPKLNGTDQVRLREEQREWIGKRETECNALKDADLQARCLWRHFGLRLFTLLSWLRYKEHLNGQPLVDAVTTVAKSARSAGEPVPNVAEMGLGDWLGSYLEHPPLLRHQFQTYQGDVTEDAVTIAGRLAPEPGQGAAGVPRERSVSLVFHAKLGIWYGDSYPVPTVYAQPGYTLDQAPEGIKAWLAQFPFGKDQHPPLSNTLPKP